MTFIEVSHIHTYTLTRFHIISLCIQIKETKEAKKDPTKTTKNGIKNAFFPSSFLYRYLYKLYVCARAKKYKVTKVTAAAAAAASSHHTITFFLFNSLLLWLWVGVAVIVGVVITIIIN